jgi:purine-binding chemotaxis protein CheW
MKKKSELKEKISKDEIDWNDIYRRLDNTGKAINNDWEPSQDKIKNILKNRALSLALPQQEISKKSEIISIVEFSLSYEKYGIETLYIREVCPFKDLTTIPGTPDFVSGIINVRGKIISVMDIKKFFGLPEKGLTDLNKVIIVYNSKMEVGIMADSIIDVRSIVPEDLQRPMPTLTGISADYIRGITSERLIVLDIEKILNDPDIIVNKDISNKGVKK